MQFQLAINMERMDDRVDTAAVARHTLEMVQLAERGGFRVVWAAEHHALEMTIAPNPFQILTWWASHTNTIRLGTAVVVAPYWHPIRLAGEAAFTDLLSGGRLEFGLGSGAYQREFDRLLPGVKQTDGWQYMHEMLPAVKGLWAGDYAHAGIFWSFPTTTSVPKPLQQPHPPIWVAARAPISFDYAVQHGCHIMSWPMTRPFAEARLYYERLQQAMTEHRPAARPIFAMMRHTAVYDRAADWEIPVRAVTRQLGQFANLFQNLGDVKNGFPRAIPLQELANKTEYDPQQLHDNLMFGTPAQVIEKLKPYADLGVDEFIYYASMGLEPSQQKRSLELFCNEVIPAFH